MNTRRISATVCGAALLAGAVTVPSATAATVGAPNDAGVCAFKMNEQEKAHFDSIELLSDPQFYENALEAAFEEAFGLALKVRTEYEAANRRGANSDNVDQIRAEQTKKLRNEAGLSADVAEWYAGEYIGETVDVDSNLGGDQEDLREDAQRAIEEGVVTAATDESGYDEGLGIPDRAGFRNELKAKFPSITDVELAQWSDAFIGSDRVVKAQQAIDFQAKFFFARQLCANGGGTAALPTAEGVTNPDAKYESKLPAPTAQGADSGINIRQKTLPYSANSKPGDVDQGADTVDPDAKKMDAANSEGSVKADSEMTPGKIAGIVIGVLALLGLLGGAAFAMLPR